MKVWIIGIKGLVSTTTIVGAYGIKHGLCPTTGLLTETELFNSLNLEKISNIEFGGHDIRTESVYQSAYLNMVENRTYDEKLLRSIKQDLDLIPVKKGSKINCGESISKLSNENKEHASLREIEKEVTRDILEFKNSDRCVVVNLASTEPLIDITKEHLTIDALEYAIDNNSGAISAGIMYAYCALKNNIPYINFTPSISNDIPALQELALINNVPHVGKDGKTGETLVKTSLAPMFKYRALNVEGWYGCNILGNMDGKILDDPRNKASKIKTKGEVLKQCLGYSPFSKVTIDYYPPLGDHKVAWDYINFTGFMGHRMNMQFTWQACDSILAAPLVLDLVRLVDFAQKNNIGGLLQPLSVYFKHPIGSNTSDLNIQYLALINWVNDLKAKKSPILERELLA